MKKNFVRRSFTLVELIVGVSIIGILSVVTFLVVTKWMGKSRDAGRRSDVANIQIALENTILKSAVYPIPDNNFSVYDTGGILAWYQGEFGINSANFVGSLNKVPTDSANQKYGYSVTYDKTHYQIRAILETTSQNHTDIANAADKQTTYIDGVYNGFIVTNSGSSYYLWNVPSLFVWSGSQISNGANYIHENSKVITNTTLLTGMDINNLYDSDTSNDNAVYTNIVSTYSPLIRDNDDAKITIQNAAGGTIGGGASSSGGSSPASGSGCVLGSSTFPCNLQ